MQLLQLIASLPLSFLGVQTIWSGVPLPRVLAAAFQALPSSRSPLPGSCSTSQRTEYGEKEVGLFVNVFVAQLRKPVQKIKSATVSTLSPSISHEVMGPDAMIFVF